ncbi:hypothetical protein AVEN_213014-1 [Araneus ventricosus]|uniref:Uncharacterized protein n=1 Tax=Araneus ventricosus TaxID=182803 RepID=A0A4Y2UTR7_ARAVE|nr:hypothetical protein AVEN_213014-1 [Araneus ventricosus]
MQLTAVGLSVSREHEEHGEVAVVPQRVHVVAHERAVLSRATARVAIAPGERLPAAAPVADQLTVVAVDGVRKQVGGPHVAANHVADA